MAKRTRGSSRPGQRRPLPRNARSTATSPARVKPASLTPEEEARAADLEARLLEEERFAEAAVRQSRDRERRTAERAQSRPVGGTLAVRAAEEYAYVARDVRRILIIAAGMFAILIGLWIALQVTGSTL